MGVSDTQSAPAGSLNAPPTCLATTLSPGASTTCTATYPATQADLDNGSINDTAIATGTPSLGPAVTSSPGSATVGVTQTGSLALTKSPSPATVSAVGQSVTYTFVVTNNTNVTVSRVNVSDTQAAPAKNLDAPPSCAATTLAPGVSTACTATYTVTQADLDNAAIVDSAVATAKIFAGATTLTSNTATATVTATQNPAVTVSKSASPTTFSRVGQPVTYTFVVKNSGNVTLSNISVSDTQATPAGALVSGPTCLATTLVPGSSTTCSATYAVTQADLDNGSVSDTATASGTSPLGISATSAPASAAVSTSQTGSLALTKSASPTTVSTVGQPVTYTFTATNNTNLTVTGLSVSDT